VGGLLTADRGSHALGVRRIGHHVERVRLTVAARMPPHDDVVEHRGVGLGEQMRVLRPSGADLGQVVAQRGLQSGEAVPAFDPDGPEVGDVEHDRTVATGEVLGDRAARVLERHLPSPEWHHLRPGRAVHAAER
jgi:hypothetical protein